jgi:hypothetical protein
MENRSDRREWRQETSEKNKGTQKREDKRAAPALEEVRRSQYKS